MYRVIFCIIGGLLVTACDSEEKKSTVNQKTTTSTSVNAQLLHESVANAKVPVVESKVVTKTVIERKADNGDKIPEIKFSPSEPVVNEELAMIARGDRMQDYQEAMASDNHVIKVTKTGSELNYDYSNHGNYGSDTCTPPINQARILHQGTIISAIIEPEIQSQFSGMITARVDRSVLNNLGTKILIPQGSKLIMSYKSVGKMDVSRIPVVLTRIIRPDGASIMLSGAEGKDQVGRTGIGGNVDNRNLEKYGTAGLISVLSALSQVASTSLSKKHETQSAGLTNLSNTAGQLTANIIEKKFDLKSIISIPQGVKIQFMLSRDLVFPKYEVGQ